MGKLNNTITGCKNFECKYVLACGKCFRCGKIRDPFECDELTHTCIDCTHFLNDCMPSMYYEALKDN